MQKLFLFLVCVIVAPAYGGTVEKFDYPELMVVPKASDRLKSESLTEGDRQWTQFLPIQISALATLIAGTQTMDSTQSGQGILGIGVGAGWLVASTLLATSYRPYQAGWERVGKMPSGTMREQLSRERAAEEELHSASAAGERLRWLSVLTEVGAVVVMVAKGNAPGTSGFTFATGMQIGAGLLALTPLIYGFHWNDVYRDQMDYKKRIYGPVAHATLLFDQKNQAYLPGFGVSLRF